MNIPTQQSGPVALAGQTRGAIGLSLNFLVTFSFKRKSDKHNIKAQTQIVHSNF
jgi:hypothetical protein